MGGRADPCKYVGTLRQVDHACCMVRLYSTFFSSLGLPACPFSNCSFQIYLGYGCASDISSPTTGLVNSVPFLHAANKLTIKCRLSFIYTTNTYIGAAHSKHSLQLFKVVLWLKTGSPPYVQARDSIIVIHIIDLAVGLRV